MSEVNTNQTEALETETNLIPENTPTIISNSIIQPSVEDILSYLSKTGKDSLMQLAPIQDLVEFARKQEKDKLYKSLEQKQGEAKQLQEQLELAQAAIKKHEEENLTFEQKLQLQINEVKQQHELLAEQLRLDKTQAEQATADAEEKARVAQLDAYKTKQLRAAGDEIILELVGGNTQEEIDASIELAKNKFAEIAARFADKSKADATQTVKDNLRVTNPASSNMKPLTSDDIRRMSPEEYAKNRDRIHAAMRDGVIE